MNYFDERCFCPRSACFVWKVSSWHSCMIMIFWNGWSFVAMRLVIQIWSLSPRDSWLGLHPKVGLFFFSTDFLTLDSRNPKSAKNVSIILEVQVRYHKDISASIISLRHSSGWYYRTLSWWCCQLLSGFSGNATADPSQRVIFDDSSTNRGTNQIVKSNELLFFICWVCGVPYYKPYPYCWHLFQSCWFWRRLPLWMLDT